MTQVRYAAVAAGEDAEQAVIDNLFNGRQTAVWSTREKLEGLIAEARELGDPAAYDIVTITVTK